jgi:hypothetical protein
MNEVDRAKQRLREVGEELDAATRTGAKGAALGAAAIGVLLGSRALRLFGRKGSSLPETLAKLTTAVALARQVIPLVAALVTKRPQPSAKAEPADMDAPL